MIKKTFDYYYLVLLRWFSGSEASTGATMGLTIWFNILSLIILFAPNTIDIDPNELVPVFVFVSPIVLMYITLLIVYNKRRRQELRIKYWRESRESRRRGQCKVILYKILSLALLVFAFSTLVP